MYVPAELASFSFSEFERGLDGLSDEGALVRMKKADGTEMNAISWSVRHIAAHWLCVSAYAKGESVPSELTAHFGADADPTPPPLGDALKLLAEAKANSEWIADSDDRLLSVSRDGLPMSDNHGNIGTAIMRVGLHTWHHIGEINAARQMLGHPTISFVGPQLGKLEWRTS